MLREDSQREQIKQWLEKGRFITPIMALQMYGCFRLSAIVYTLKYDYGMNIVTEMVYEKNGRRYAKYYLKK
jgi:hypothetical protein